MPQYREFPLRREMVKGYLGETGWLRLFDPLNLLRTKVEPRRGIYLFRINPPAHNLEIYKRLHNSWIPQIYSQITNIGGMKSKRSASVRYDIFKRAIEDYHTARNRDVDRPSKYSLQRLEKSRILKEYRRGLHVKIYYTNSDEAEMYLLGLHVKNIGCKPPWEMK